MASDPHPHHRWGLRKGPPARFPRDVPHAATHEPARPARPPQDMPDPQPRISIAARIQPELHAVVDRTLEHVAALQAEAVRGARHEAHEVHRRERAAFQKMLTAMMQHADGLDRFAESMSGIARSLQQELEAIDAAVAGLTGEAPAPPSASAA
jgi:hypothetical protein